jgi:hypothetical protein
MERAWERLAGEPELWHKRFLGYCVLGPERTVHGCYRLHRMAAGAQARATLPREWRAASARWQWEERAAAWDAAQERRAEAPGEVRRQHARRRRLELLDRLIAQTAAALESAHLEQVEPEQVRAMLPTLRQLLRDLLAAERAEYPPERAAAGATPTLRGDEAPLSDEEIARVQAGLLAFHEAREGTPATRRRADREAAQAEGSAQGRPALLVCVGPDPALAYDLAMLRAVKQQTGLHFERMVNCTADDLVQQLRRERSHGRPVRWLHLACHGGPDGVQLADGIVDGEWLSAHLQGVEVLLVAACRGDRVGDWLAVVPWVVTLREEISHGDAGTLAHYFWLAMAGGAGPADALEAALARSSPHVAEFVVRHW